MKLCLIRHGETVYNIDERMQGVRDVELSPRGREEAVLLGKRLRDENIAPQRVYCSPVKRARDTAEQLGLPVPVVTIAGLRARNLGQLEGLTKSEIRSRFPGALEGLVQWDYLPPGGDETLGDIFRRAERDIGFLVEREESTGLLLAVTHSGVLEALVRGWLKVPGDRPLPFPLKNAGALLFNRIPSGWQPERQIEIGTRDAYDGA